MRDHVATCVITSVRYLNEYLSAPFFSTSLSPSSSFYSETKGYSTADSECAACIIDGQTDLDVEIVMISKATVDHGRENDWRKVMPFPLLEAQTDVISRR